MPFKEENDWMDFAQDKWVIYTKNCNGEDTGGRGDGLCL